MPAGAPEQIQFPLGGVARSSAYQNQQPFTCYDAKNARGKSALGERIRGGSRPGLANLFSAIGGGEPIRNISTLTPIPTAVLGTRWWDDFLGTSLKPWWNFHASTGTVGSGKFTCTAGVTDQLYRSLPATLKASSGYTIRGSVEGDSTANANVFILQMNSSEVSVLNQVQFRIVQSTGAWQIRKVVAGVTTNITTGTSSVPSSSTAFEMALAFDGTSGYTASINGSTVGTGTYATPYPNGQIGLILAAVTGSAYFYNFRLDFANIDSAQYFPQTLYETANGRSYLRDSSGALTEVQSAYSTTYRKVADDQHIRTAEFGGKLYIADPGRTLLSSQDQASGTITTGVLDDGDIDDWTAYGIDPNRHVAVILDHASAGMYSIASVNPTGGLTLIGKDGAVPANGGCSWRVTTSMKVFDPEHRTVSHLFGTGFPPVGSSMAARFVGRLLTAGDDSDPQNWMASREGDPEDFDLVNGDAGDTTRAVTGNDAGIGAIGSPITAICAVKDDYCILAAENETYVMRGNPAGNGRIDCADENLGVIYRSAICTVPGGVVYGMTREGLARSNGYEWQLMSKERIPLEMLNIDVTVTEVELAYDPQNKGIEIIFRPRAETAGTAWFYDIANDAYWPDLFAANIQPFAMCEADVTAAGGRVLLFGGQDGITRNFDDAATGDGGVAFTSYIIVGPIQNGAAGYQGILESLTATLDELSGNVAWALYEGASAKAAVTSSSAFDTGTWVAGLNATSRPNAIGVASAIKLSATAPWVIESMFMTRYPTGIAVIA